MQEEIQSNPELIKNLMVSFGDIFLKNMTSGTRERLFKDGLRQEVHNLVMNLNNVYPDVSFNFIWHLGTYATHMKNDQYFRDGFDRDVADDAVSWVDCLQCEEDKEKLYEADLQELGMVLFFHWNRKCDLGHRHRTTRFYHYSMPKIVELIGYHLLGPPDMKEYIKMYVPNFFY